MRRRDRLRAAISETNEAAQLAASVGVHHLAAARALVGEPLPFIRRAVWELVDNVVGTLGPPRCKGPSCAGCCHGAVPVMAIEVERIRSVVTPAIRARAQEMAEIDETDPMLPFVRCPALDPVLRTCQIYAERPIVCRSHASWDDPKNCNPGESGPTTVTQIAGFIVALMYAHEPSSGPPVLLHDVLAEVPDVG